MYVVGFTTQSARESNGERGGGWGWSGGERGGEWKACFRYIKDIAQSGVVEALIN